MSGSRLGRCRGGRLAVYGACGVVVVLLVFLYRAATSEMARLRELHIQCAHQQEALAAQLQVIFEYKVRLEKSLAEEKSSNAAVKQELQQCASRFNSLQQTYKLLQTEHQDLQEECKKREKEALEDTNRLEATLRELRSRIRQAREDKEKALENLKTKFLELDTEKTRLEEKYKIVLKSSGNTNSTIEHLRKEVFQLKRELEEAKRSSNKATSPGPSIASPQSSKKTVSHMKAEEVENAEQPVGPPQQQQVSPPMNDDKIPQPLLAPLDTLQSNEQRANEEANEFNSVQFAQKNGNIVPVGLNELKEGELRDSLPLPYDLQEKRQKKLVDQPVVDNPRVETEKTVEKDENSDEEQLKQVIPPPNENNEKSRPFQNIDSLAHPVEKVMTVSPQPIKKEEKFDKAQNNDEEIARDVLNQLINGDLVDTR